MKKLLLTISACLLGSILMPLHADELSYQLDKARIAIARAQVKHDNDALANALSVRATIFFNYALSDSIYATVPQDLETLKRIEQWDTYYRIWSYLINTYIYYDKSKNTALREVQAMFDDALKRDHKYGQGIAYYAMGNVYLNMNNLDESANSFLKSIDILSTLKPLPVVTQEVYSYYGDVLNEQKKYVELEHFTVRWHKFLTEFLSQHGKDLEKEEQDILWFNYYIACAQAAIGEEKYPQAEEMLNKAHGRVSSDVTYEGVAWMTNMAQLRLKQGRYIDALALNTRRMNLIAPDEDKAIFLNAATQRAEILTQLGRFEESSRLYREMFFIKDSIGNADTKQQLNEMNTLFQVDEIKMEKERAQFRNTLIIVGLIVVALVIFTVFRMIAARRLKRAHEKLEQAHGELEKTHSDLLTAYDQLEETTAAKERIESDLRIARNIQMGMVPRSFPERPDLDLYASMTPAKEVGGDLYGYYLTGDKLYIALGDVSGKGVPASLFMAQATRLFRTLAAQEMMPAEIATRINDALSGEDNETGMFVTMFLGLIDLQTGHLDFCNAGHNPPVLLKDGKPEFVEMIPNAPVGIIPELEFEGEEIQDISNCALFVYTDGLNEAENRQQEQFSDERLLEIMETVPFESCKQTIEMLREEVEKHRDGAEPNDDLTMLCVKVIKSNN